MLRPPAMSTDRLEAPERGERGVGRRRLRVVVPPHAVSFPNQGHPVGEARRTSAAPPATPSRRRPGGDGRRRRGQGVGDVVREACATARRPPTRRPRRDRPAGSAADPVVAGVEPEGRRGGPGPGPGGRATTGSSALPMATALGAWSPPDPGLGRLVGLQGGVDVEVVRREVEPGRRRPGRNRCGVGQAERRGLDHEHLEAPGRRSPRRAARSLLPADDRPHAGRFEHRRRSSVVTVVLPSVPVTASTRPLVQLAGPGRTRSRTGTPCRPAMANTGCGRGRPGSGAPRRRRPTRRSSSRRGRGLDQLDAERAAAAARASAPGRSSIDDHRVPATVPESARATAWPVTREARRAAALAVNPAPRW